MKKIRKKSIKRWTDFIVGIFLFSFGFTLFLLPNNLVFGGVTGLSIVFKEIYGIDASLFVLIADILLLVISYIFLGKEKTARSVWGYLLLPVVLKLNEILVSYIAFDNNIELIIAAVFGGVLSGVGIGLVYRTGFTTGGTDIINQLINKYLKLSMGKAMLICDGLIIFTCLLVFDFRTFLYALIVLYIISTITDRVILGVSKSKAFYIVTDKTTEVKKFVLNEMGHGVTLLEAVGGYTRDDQKVLFCVIPTREYYILKEGIYKIDANAFFVATDAYEVYGGE